MLHPPLQYACTCIMLHQYLQLQPRSLVPSCASPCYSLLFLMLPAQPLKTHSPAGATGQPICRLPPPVHHQHQRRCGAALTAAAAAGAAEGSSSSSPSSSRPTPSPAAPWRSLQSPNESSLPPGKCWLAGVGPGSWDHVSVKVARLISEADAIVYDDLGAQELLSAAPSWAEQLYVGKRGGQASTKQPEIDALLVQLCKQDKRVVRLKGGCPSTFSRVSSEASALSAAGCPFELVPGLSTATAAAVLAGFPLTDAQLAGAYAVVSGHDAGSIYWAAFSQIPTLVVLMGGRALPVIVQQLQATGWQDSTPVAVVKEAGTAAQRAWFSTLKHVEQDTRAGAPLSPCIIVVGEVAALPATWKQMQPDAGA